MQGIEDAFDCINIVHGVVYDAKKGSEKVALAGVVVNDHILLVNFIKHYHSKTKSIADVAPKASQAHFRAVFFTSATTIVGLVPMLS
tara:strand:- start:155 stop:415 length:261 start_codon:yes stop_codon:yes gene_type:complete